MIKDLVKESKEFHSGLIASYYLGRYNDFPKSFWDLDEDPAILEDEPEKLKNIIKNNFEIFYSDFITRLISDFSRYFIPNSRAISFEHVKTEIINEEKMFLKISRAFKDYPKDTIERIDDWDLVPGAYPVYTFLKKLPKLTNERSFLDRFNSIKIMPGVMRSW